MAKAVTGKPGSAIPARLLCLALSLAVLPILGCGEEGVYSSGGSGGPFGVSIDAPSDGPGYTFTTEQVSAMLSGGVLESPLGNIEDYVCNCVGLQCLLHPELCQYLYYPRVQVAVTNLANGESCFAWLQGNDVAMVGSRFADYRWTAYLPLAIGENTIVVEATDGEGHQAQDQIVIVTPDWEPTAGDDTFSVTIGQQVSIDVLANDTHPAGSPLLVVEVTQGTIGSVSIGAAGGSVIYTSNGVATGPDSFSYTIRDLNGSPASAVVRGTVSP